jgi:hypothetical protein
VGDRGQRYEVSVIDEATQQRVVCGWTNDKTSAERMAIALALRPGWRHGQVRDRQAGK